MVSNKKQAAREAQSRPSAPPPCPSKDLFQRINFSYQSAIFLQQLNLDAAPSDTERDRKGKRKGAGNSGEDLVRESSLARGTMKATRKMAVHNQLKLDPSLKRTICKKCSTILIPGLTSRARNRPDRNHFNVSHHTCLICTSVLSLPSPPTYIKLTEGIILDGMNRRRRRENCAKRSKVAFHDREKAGDGEKGHSLWQGDTITHHWGTSMQPL